MANHLQSGFSVQTQKEVSFKSFRTDIAVWLLVTLLIFSACQSNPASKQNIRTPDPVPADILVPRWYAEMPTLPGCRLAYAQSGVFINADRQKKVLQENGAANLAKSSSVALDVGWAGTQKNIYSRTASYIKEENWQNLAKNLKENLEIIKTYRLNQSMLALVGICPGQSDIEGLAAALDDSLVNISSNQPPSWVSDPLQVAGQFFGVGTASGHTTVGKAWQEAERQARADIAMRLAAQYQVLENTMAQNSYATAQLISETRAKLTLQNLQVIRHAYSHSGRIFYALISIPAAAR